MRTTKERICVLGLGSAGLPLAAAWAAQGRTVVGIDSDLQLVDDIRQRRLRCLGEGLAAAIAAAGERLRVTSVLPESSGVETYVIAVGTPADAEHGFDRAQLDAAVAAISNRLRPGDLVVMRSTVPIGTTRALSAGFAAIGNVGVACCPDRSLGGNVFREIHRLPQIVGGTTERARTRAARLFASLGVEIIPVESVEAAEAVKLIANVERDVLFGLANEIAMICDAAGLNAAHVISSGRHGYPRSVLPDPGPVGGPCLSKDTFLFAAGLRRHHVHPEIALAARSVNARVASHAATFIARHLVHQPGSPVIAILGVAYKGTPETAATAGSVAGALRAALAAQLPNAVFRGWDPVAAKDALAALGLTPCNIAVDAAAGAAVLVLANDHPEISALRFDALGRSLRRPGLIYDLWSWKRSAQWKLPDGVVYRAFGCQAGHEPPAPETALSHVAAFPIERQSKF